MVLRESAEIDLKAMNGCVVHRSALAANLPVGLRQGVWYESSCIDLRESVAVDPVAEFGCESQEPRLLLVARWSLVVGGSGERSGCIQRHLGLMSVSA
jgi:hypothetical protein